MSDFTTTSIAGLTLRKPCPSMCPLVRIGLTDPPFLAVGCHKDKGHEGDHEWVLRWSDQ